MAQHRQHLPAYLLRREFDTEARQQLGEDPDRFGREIPPPVQVLDTPLVSFQEGLDTGNEFRRRDPLVTVKSIGSETHSVKC